MHLYDAIAFKFKFALPLVYRTMEATGFFDLKHPGTPFYLKNEPTYLWIPEAEWLRPEEILAYEPAPYHKAGFVPFAQTGACDQWCWWPSEDREAVVLCPHDDMTGTFDAPNFCASIYRRCLEYALVVRADEEHWVPQQFEDWAVKLAEYFPQRWIETLQAMANAEIVEWHEGRLRIPTRGLLTPIDYNALIARDIAFRRIDQRFEWTNPKWLSGFPDAD